jgi:hypothetical protein
MNAKLLLAFVLFVPATATAHRLDEYLQATRISVELNRVIAEINLTPGAAVADNVFTTIDRDGDRDISPAEGAAYAEVVVKSVSLEIDGQPHSLTLVSYTIPSLSEMRRGEGILRLRATAGIAELSAGRHQLRFRNTHRSDIGVYLINALIPADSRIHITGQSRDVFQRQFEMQYAIAASREDTALAAALPPLLSLAMAGAFWVIARHVAHEKCQKPKS